MKNLKTGFGAKNIKKDVWTKYILIFLFYKKSLEIIKKAILQGFFYITYIFSSSVISDNVLL